MMKQFIVAIALIVSITSFGQENTNFKVENNFLVWEKVYEVPNKSAKEIETLLTSKLPSLPKTKEYFKSGTNASIQFDNYEMDLKKFGAKWATTPPILLHPVSGNINTQWKDGKYRIIVSGLVAHVLGSSLLRNWEYETQFVRNGGLNKKAILANGLAMVDKFFTELFNFSNQPKSDW